MGMKNEMFPTDCNGVKNDRKIPYKNNSKPSKITTIINIKSGRIIGYESKNN